MIQRGGMTLYSDFLYLTPLKPSMAQALYFESKLEREEQIGNHLPGTTEHLPFVKYLLDVRQWWPCSYKIASGIYPHFTDKEIQAYWG